MKKQVKILWIVMAAVLFLLPFPLSYFLRERLDTENYENRELAEAPSVSIKNFKEFPEKFDNYLNDHLPFRNELIAAKGMISLKIFGESPSDKVIKGRDGWYFYNASAAGDEDTVADYQGTNLYTEKQLLELTQNLVKSRDALSQKGIEFVVFMAPDKERVYSDKMPSAYGKPAETSRMLQVYHYLKENTDLRVVCVEQDLKDAREEYPDYDFYYHLDTHWNNLGSYVGAKSLLKELGITIPEISELSLDKINNSSFDLAGMMNLKKYLNEDVDYIVGGFTEHTAQNQLWEQEGMLRYISDGTDERKLMVIRDSYTLWLAQYLAPEFGESCYPHRKVYTTELLDEESPDIVVIEVAERYLDRLRTMKITD